MNKEKEIKELKSFLECDLPIKYDIDTYWNDCYPQEQCTEIIFDYETIAKNLVNEGYGNVKNAIKEFAEKLKSKAFFGYDDLNKEEIHAVDVSDIEELIREFINS